MKAICLIDTSIFVEILQVPGKSTHYGIIIRELEGKIHNSESLFLPMATVLETGNHIAQNGDGNQRRVCAEKFVTQVTKALRNESPFQPIGIIDRDELSIWLDNYPDSAMQGMGLGDLSIMQDWKRLCALHSGRRVYIWSLDEHLKVCDQPARI